MLKIKVAINSDLSLTCTDLYDSNKKIKQCKIQHFNIYMSIFFNKHKCLENIYLIFFIVLLIPEFSCS